jgi:hypothetical protein
LKVEAGEVVIFKLCPRRQVHPIGKERNRTLGKKVEQVERRIRWVEGFIDRADRFVPGAAVSGAPVALPWSRLLRRSFRNGRRTGSRLDGWASRQAFPAISTEVTHRRGSKAVEGASSIRTAGDENVRNKFHAAIGQRRDDVDESCRV